MEAFTIIPGVACSRAEKQRELTRVHSSWSYMQSERLEEKASLGGMGRGAQQWEGLPQSSDIYGALPGRWVLTGECTRLTTIIPPTHCLSKCTSQSGLKISVWGLEMMAITKDAWRSFPSWPSPAAQKPVLKKTPEGLHWFRVSLDLSVLSVRMEGNAAAQCSKFPPDLACFTNRKSEFKGGRWQGRREPAPLHRKTACSRRNR